jgi:hypothetical protein
MLASLVAASTTIWAPAAVLLPGEELELPVLLEETLPEELVLLMGGLLLVELLEELVPAPVALLLLVLLEELAALAIPPPLAVLVLPGAVEPLSAVSLLPVPQPANATHESASAGSILCRIYITRLSPCDVCKSVQGH